MTNRNFRQIINLLDLRWQRRVPVIHQTETAECGLACLAMICGHFGKNIDLIYLRRKFNLSARGATLAGINGIAEQLGMATRALSLELDELRVLKTPCILHWDFSHFVVLVSVKRNRYVLHDPARGIRYISREEMSRYFTGVALEVWPGSEFQSETLQTRISLRSLINSIYGIKRTLAKIFCLSVVIEAILLRLGLAYGPGGMSLREVTAWAQLHDVATLSDVALLKRLRNAADWFGILAAQTLAVRAAVTGCTSGKRLRLVDGTAISAPGGGSAEWRLHMGYDPHTCQFTDFELTDSRDAERLDRFAQTADEIRIADRGF
ncbi:colicin V secretion/processing ATP-binding protein CvaB, partial [Escherichia coli M718]